MMYYFKKIENKKIVGVESNSHGVASPGLINATEKEYTDFIAALPPPEPPESVVDTIRRVVLTMKSGGEI